MEDDGLQPAYSLIAIPVKVERLESVASTSRQSAVLIKLIKEDTVADKMQRPRCRCRKQKSMEKIEESLEQLMAR